MRDFVSGFRFYNHAAMQIAASTEATLLDHQDIGTLLLMKREGKRIVEVPLAMLIPKIDRSRIFRSWAYAVRYVIASTILGIAHGRRIATKSNLM